MLKYDSELERLLAQRPLVLKPAKTSVGRQDVFCLHDAVSGEILGSQCEVTVNQRADKLTTATVTFIVDGRYLRIEGGS